MRSLRTWLIRGVALAVLALAGGGAWVVSEWVNPDRVRELLVAALREQMPDTEVEVEAAQLRLFGGIAAANVKLTRKGETEPFFAAPAVRLAHDKEQLHRGRLILRKIELDGPTIRVGRRADGSWSVVGLFKPGPADRPMPTLVIKNATVVVTDARPDPLPPLTLTAARFQVVNDPLPVVRVDGAFTLSPGPPAPSGSAVAGGLAVPMTVSVRLNKVDQAVHVRVEVPDLPLTPDLTPALAKLHPAAGDYVAPFTAHVGIRADVHAAGGLPPKFDVKVDVRDGRYDDPTLLPWPLEHIAGTVHYKDGKVTVDKATARLGPAGVELALETRPLADVVAGAAGADGPRKQAEAALDGLTVKVTGLPLDDELFAKLPPSFHRTRAMLSPAGSVDVAVTAARTPAGLRKEYDVRPNRLSIAYEKFRYPVHDLRGSVKRVVAPDGTDEFQIAVDGTAGGRPVGLTGRVSAEGPGVEPLIDLKLTGMDFPIDGRLVAAMPAKSAALLGKLHPTGRADFTVDIRQPKDADRCENTIKVRVYDGSANPVEHFPYPLTDIRGHVVLHLAGKSRRGQAKDDDRIELRDFHARHGGGRLRAGGTFAPIPDSADRRLTLDVAGEELPLDADFKAAADKLKVGGLWAAVNPRGALQFAAHIEVTDRAGPPPSAVAAAGPGPVVPAAASLPGEPGFDPAADLSLIASFKGPTVTPRAFPYELTDIAGTVRYAGGKLDLGDLKAKHGSTAVAVDAAEVRFGAGGEVWANVGAFTARPLALDAALMSALPERARTGLAELKLAGPMDLSAKHVVVRVPASTPETAADPLAGAVVYWNAELKLNGAAADVGTAWTDVFGAVASVGRFEGGRLGAVVGNAWFDRATIARQPLTNMKLTYRVRPARPDPASAGAMLPMALEFPDLTADLFHGTVGGEARVDFGEAMRFKLWLTAAGVRIDELATHWHLGQGAELRGLAQGKLLLENPPDPVTGMSVLTGSGQIDVPNGRLLNLPVLLPMLKLLKLQTPDQTAFEEAHAVFDLRGDRVRVSQLDLVGSALSLGGVGELDIKGEDVRFEFYTVWSQALRRWLATPLGDVTSALSGNLFRIEMTKRPGGKMEYKPHMLPVITDPVKAVAERLRNRLGPAPVADGPVGPATYRATGGR